MRASRSLGATWAPIWVMVATVLDQPAASCGLWLRVSRPWQVPQRCSTSWPTAASASAGTVATALALGAAGERKPLPVATSKAAKPSASPRRSNGALAFTAMILRDRSEALADADGEAGETVGGAADFGDDPGMVADGEARADAGNAGAMGRGAPLRQADAAEEVGNYDLIIDVKFVAEDAIEGKKSRVAAAAHGGGGIEADVAVDIEGQTGTGAETIGGSEQGTAEEGVPRRSLSHGRKGKKDECKCCKCAGLERHEYPPMT